MTKTIIGKVTLETRRVGVNKMLRTTIYAPNKRVQIDDGKRTRDEVK